MLSAFARKSPLFSAWLLFFLYAAAAAATIQLLILPIAIPSLHIGHGLIRGGDSIGYHEIASAVATEIGRVGWQAWSLAPQGQTPAGLAAPFYALIAPEPWSLIPVNAALHASAGIIVMHLLRILGTTTGIAFAGALMWVAFPSSMQWVSQIQKDGYTVAGMLMVMLGWVQLWRSARSNAAPEYFFYAILLILAGICLAGLARAYGFELLKAGSIIAACIALPSLIKNWRAGNSGNMRPAIAVAVFLLLPLALAYAPRYTPTMAYSPWPKESSALDWKMADETSIRRWERTPWLPAAVDHALMRASIGRGGYIAALYAGAGSGIDRDIQFHNAGEFAAYLPRAMQIGFLAPFPADWFSSGASPGGTLMRIDAGIEMAVVYVLLLLGLPLAVIRWRARVEFWICVLFCSALVTIFAYVTPNVGTLYRLRYGFEMTLAAIGFAGLAMALRRPRAYRF